MSSDKIVHVTDASFDQEVLKSDTPVLVDFWAPWCGPCHAIAPILDDLAGEYSGRLKIAKINVDDNPQTPGRYGVRGIPNLLIIKGGQVKFKVPAETQNGTKIRLRGLGLPDPKGGPAGDMYAEVRVQLPVPMDERTRNWAAEQPS